MIVDQVDKPCTLADDTNGVLGSTLEYLDDTGVEWFGMVPDINFSAFDFLKTGDGEDDHDYDPTQAYSNIGEAPFIPFWLADFQAGFYVTPAYKQDKGHDIVRKLNGNNFNKLYDRAGRLNNVDIVLTSDTSKWSRCVISEAATDEYTIQQGESEGNALQFDLRQSPSVGKYDGDGDGKPDPDGDGIGMGWFPGYALDVETGKRLNIFFSENSTYGGYEFIDTLFTTRTGVGRDMLFNPTSDIIVISDSTYFDIWNYALGGQHFLYVTNTVYDSCAALRVALTNPNKNKKAQGLLNVTWAGLVIGNQDTEMLPLNEGLIPNDVKIQIRVANPFTVNEYDENKPNLTFLGDNNGYGAYEFDLTGLAPTDIEVNDEENPLSMVNVAPNPYYAYSPYETSQFTQRVKITNLPGQCTVTIYSLDGKFIRQFRRDEVGVDYRASGRSNPAITKGQIYPDVEWDLKNSRGIPVSSGVYLIHISSDDLGAERTIKWFGINRKFDPTGL